MPPDKPNISRKSTLRKCAKILREVKIFTVQEKNMYAKMADFALFLTTFLVHD
jgi:hypothetical protein